MDRRRFLGAVGIGLASLFASGTAHAEKNLTQIIESPQQKEFEQLVKVVLPGFIDAKYRFQMDGTRENLEKLAKIGETVRKYDEKLDIGIFNDGRKAALKMMKNGYVYQCTDSMTDENAKSYMLGKISKEFYLNRNGKKIKIIFYDETVPMFESYKNSLTIFGKNLPEYDMILIDNTNIADYAKDVLRRGQEYRNRPLKDYERFYAMMIMKECDEKGSSEKVAQGLKDAYLNHELSHATKNLNGLEDEVRAQLVQICHQPFLTLAMLEESSLYDAEKSQVYKRSADAVFSVIKDEGYSKEDILRLDAAHIRDLARKLRDKNLK